MGAETSERWLDDLRSTGESRERALADLGNYLRRSLAKGFGRQLDDSDLEDLTQDSLMKILEKLGSFRGESRFSTWSTSIAVNQALSLLRKRKVRNLKLEQAQDAGRDALLTTTPGEPRSAEELLSQAQGHRVLQQAMAEALSDLQRQAIYAKLGGLPMVRISEDLGRSPGAVYKIIHDARKNLLTYLEKNDLSVNELLAPTGGTS